MKAIWEYIKTIGGVLVIFIALLFGYLEFFGSNGAPPEPEKPVTLDADPFTLSCDTVYNFDGNTSLIVFKVSIEPRVGDYYQFDWSGYSSSIEDKYWFNKLHRDMTDEIRKLQEMDETTIRSGYATIDRNTGKFEFSSETSGTCKRIEYVPIPRASF